MMRLAPVFLLLTACSGWEERAPLMVLEEQQAAWNEGDLETFVASGYWESPDLTFFSGGSAQRGYEETRARFLARYGGGAEMGTLEFTTHGLQHMGEGHALVTGGYRLAYQDGSVNEGLFTLHMRDIPGVGWRIVHDHTSTDQD